MKRLYLSLLLVCAVLPSGVFAENKSEDPAVLYAQAVESYIQGAMTELRAIRTEVDASIKKSPTKARVRFATVSEKLGTCEKLLADLKAADPSKFDTIKLNYESTRAELVAALLKARQG